MNGVIPSWRDDAICRGRLDVDFFPETHDDSADACALCEVCPVREQCLAWAIDTRQQFGIWGGAGTLERNRLRAGVLMG